MITYEHVNEVNPHAFHTDASTIGLAPGSWPEKIETEIGNKMPFFRHRVVEHEGDLICVHYKQTLGCADLAIFND